jgi:hypothetical protein
MSEAEDKIIIQPIAGLDFQIIPHGLAMTIRYYVQVDDAAASQNAMQALTVGPTAAQAIELASSLKRAAQMIQAQAGPPIVEADGARNGRQDAPDQG